MLFSKNDINKGIEVYESTAGSILVDVREADEYATGYIPDAVNVPLSGIQNTTHPTDKPKTPEGLLYEHIYPCYTRITVR
jgi:rhodanese-related sulfurtransferase